MRHHNNQKKFGRNQNQRIAFMRSLALNLIEHGRIETTQTRAKALRPFIEKMVTKARENNLSATRLLVSRLGGQEEAVKKLVNEIAPRYEGRNGGYTRILKLPYRKSDATAMSLIEFV